MVGARRAAPEGDATPSAVAELGTVTPARRAFGEVKQPTRIARYVMAPLAILSVGGLAAALMFVPPDSTAVDQTDPANVHSAPLGVSRNQARQELTPTPTPTPTPSLAARPTPTVTPTQAASPSVAPTPAATSPSAVALAAPQKSAPAAAPKTVDYTTLGAAAGTRYATSSVNLRKGPGKEFDTVDTLSVGEAITITDREVDGWRQATVGKRSGWVKASFLTEKKPAAQTTSSTASKSTSSSKASASDSGETKDTGLSGATCKKAGNLESHLTSRTAKVLRAVCAKFDGVSSYGGYRPGAGSYHGSGRAIDIMVSGDYGWEIAKWARANASELGVIEVIYQQKIWTTQRSGDGWRSMSSRGSATANHYDHVHLSVR